MNQNEIENTNNSYLYTKLQSRDLRDLWASLFSYRISRECVRVNVCIRFKHLIVRKKRFRPAQNHPHMYMYVNRFLFPIYNVKILASVTRHRLKFFVLRSQRYCPVKRFPHCDRTTICADCIGMPKHTHSTHMSIKKMDSF